MLPKEAVLEFIEIYFKNFGVRLPYEEGEEKANKVFNFFNTIIKPIKESTNLADENTGNVSDAERNEKDYDDKKKI